MMECSAAQSKVFPYVDGELAADERRQLDAHLARCAPCRRLVDLEIAFRDTYVRWLRPEPAPERVRARVAAALRKLPPPSRRDRRRHRLARLGLGLAAALLLAVGIGAGMALQAHLAPRTTLAELADAAVEQHQKLVDDVLPPDIKGVPPKAAEEWFRKRLAFNVNLPDVKARGFQFLGGRISHLRDIEVAAVEYRVDDSRVSLFIIPEEAYRRLRLGDKPRFKVVSRRGYDVVVWRSQGAGYTLVSDVGDRACLVCHAPQEKLEPLPRPSAHL